MFASEETKNFTVILVEDLVGGGLHKTSVRLHRDLLVSCSPFFARLLANSAGGVSRTHQGLQLRIPPHHTEAAIFLLYYLYEPSHALRGLRAFFAKDEGSVQHVARTLHRSLRLADLLEISRTSSLLQELVESAASKSSAPATPATPATPPLPTNIERSPHRAELLTNRKALLCTKFAQCLRVLASSKCVGEPPPRVPVGTADPKPDPVPSRNRYGRQDSPKGHRERKLRSGTQRSIETPGKSQGRSPKPVQRRRQPPRKLARELARKLAKQAPRQASVPSLRSGRKRLRSGRLR